MAYCLSDIQSQSLSPDWSLAPISVTDAGALFPASCGTKSSNWKWNGGRCFQTLFTKLNCFWLCGESDTKWHRESNLQHHSEQPQRALPDHARKHTPTHAHTLNANHTINTHTHTITPNHTVLAHSHTFTLFLSFCVTHTHARIHPPRTGALRPEPFLYL